MLTVYRASAGSGKTHTLTGFYLELAFQYPHKFKEILAVTFTNKAAAEMKDRIVAELFSVVKNGAKSAHFATVKLVQPSWTEAQIVRHATLILRELLHNYSECAV
ncbi:MAG: hypothetical protein RIS47_2331, partial [Bacteroidota bacterium]